MKNVDPRIRGGAAPRSKAVLAIFEARGVAVTDAERARILSCTDVDLLERWVRRTVSVERAAELFEDEARPSTAR